MSWLGKLTQGLAKSTKRLADNITGLATGTLPLDDERLDEIEGRFVSSFVSKQVVAGSCLPQPSPPAPCFPENFADLYCWFQQSESCPTMTRSEPRQMDLRIPIVSSVILP